MLGLSETRAPPASDHSSAATKDRSCNNVHSLQQESLGCTLKKSTEAKTGLLFRKRRSLRAHRSTLGLGRSETRTRKVHRNLFLSPLASLTHLLLSSFSAFLSAHGNTTNIYFVYMPKLSCSPCTFKCAQQRLSCRLKFSGV